jgi:hypothetical protein
VRAGMTRTSPTSDPSDLDQMFWGVQSRFVLVLTDALVSLASGPWDHPKLGIVLENGMRQRSLRAVTREHDPFVVRRGNMSNCQCGNNKTQVRKEYPFLPLCILRVNCIMGTPSDATLPGPPPNELDGLLLGTSCLKTIASKMRSKAWVRQKYSEDGGEAGKEGDS